MPKHEKAIAKKAESSVATLDVFLQDFLKGPLEEIPHNFRLEWPI